MSRAAIFIHVAIITALLIAFVFARGFGWDGDTIILASQFVKLINPSIFGTFDLGTIPKPGMLLIAGGTYVISNGFYLLTLVAIVLNAWVLVRLSIYCRYQGEGAKLIPFVGLLTVFWLQVVGSADAPAFSIPFLILGLIYWLENRKPVVVILCLLASSLFRPGGELILFAIGMLEFRQNKIKAAQYMGFSIITLLLSLQTWRLAYFNYQQYWDYVTTIKNRELDYELYYHSLYAWVPYFKSLVGLIFYPAILPITLIGVIGFMQLKKDKTRWVLPLLILSSFTTVAATFVYGMRLGTINRILEVSFIAMFFFAAGWAWIEKQIGKINDRMLTLFKPCIVYSVIPLSLAFVITVGIVARERYEIHPDGSGAGELGWKSLVAGHELLDKYSVLDGQSRAAVDKRNMTFLTLEYGSMLKEITLIEKDMKIDCSYDFMFVSEMLNNIPNECYDIYDFGNDVYLAIINKSV